MIASRRNDPGMTMRVRNAAFHAALLVTAVIATGCKSCTTSGDNEPPTVVLSGVPPGAFVVGGKMIIQVDAEDPEGSALSFDWDHKPKDQNWTVDTRAIWLASTNHAIFEWDPLASDATNGVPTSAR